MRPDLDKAELNPDEVLGGDPKNSYFTKIHNEEYILSKKRLYMTATPRIFDEKSKARAANREDIVLYSMEEGDCFGKIFYRLPFNEAVTAGLLSDYKVIIVAVSEAHMRAMVDKYEDTLVQTIRKSDPGLSGEEVERKRRGKAIDSKFAAQIIGSWKALSRIDEVEIDERGRQIRGKAGAKRKPMKRAVGFATTIARSKKIQESFGDIQDYFDKHGDKVEGYFDVREYGFVKVETDHIDGKMDSRKRKRRLGWLSGQDLADNSCRLLSNAKCLSEGVDVPTLDAVVFFDERKSVVDIVQAVGRVMRRAEGKKFGYVVLPICIPSSEIEDYDNYISKGTAFKKIWQVVRALRAHDERFATEAFIRSKIEFTPPAPPPEPPEGGDEPGPVQPGLFFSLEELSEAIYTAIPSKLGDKKYWATWAKDVSETAKTVTKILAGIFKAQENQRIFDDFVNSLRSCINPSVAEQEALEMLAQHILTRRVFESLFADDANNYSFVENNPVSQSLQRILSRINTEEVEREMGQLERFYGDVAKRVEIIGKDDDKEKQKLIRELYDTFFREGFPLMAERLGIAYTPIPVVDFVLRSADAVLRKEFSQKLDDDNVHIIDPFTGTGSFIVRLIQNKALISDERLPHKYAEELYANEYLLLAYYIASINTEIAYHDRMGEHKPFGGIVLTDTFQLLEGAQPSLGEQYLPYNNARANQQRKTPIKVIIGNPPWSAGQRSENDNNKNQAYPGLDGRIKATYAKRSSATLKNSLYDSYIRAIRWSTDRIAEEGVVAIVTNGGWLDGAAGSGIRACLADEFDAIWVVNLRGNARTTGEVWRKEGAKIFGQSSRALVTVLVLAKNPNNKREVAEIFYHDIGDYLNLKDKFAILDDSRGAVTDMDGLAIADLKFKKIVPDGNNDWINRRDPRFDGFAELGNKLFKQGKPLPNTPIFRLFCAGVKTNRDAWMYNFDKRALDNNTRSMIDFYNEERIRLRGEGIGVSEIGSHIIRDSEKISWDGTLITSLAKDIAVDFDKTKIRRSLYRPFTRQHLYFDRELNNSVYRLPSFFSGGNEENLLIVVSGVGANEFSALMSKDIPNLHLVDSNQCFPRYYYDDRGGRIDNITPETLSAYRKRYRDESISLDDIFYYCYGALHAPDYRKAFASNLQKQLPRIPFAPDFWAFAQAGRRLSDLHVNFDEMPEYELDYIDSKGNLKLGDLPSDADHCRVEKMKWLDDDRSRLYCNQHISLGGIPAEAHQYSVNGKTPVDWLIDRFQIKKDKDSGLVNDPNAWRPDDPRYIIKLIKRLTHVSVETSKIIKSLPRSLPWPAEED